MFQVMSVSLGGGVSLASGCTIYVAYMRVCKMITIYDYCNAYCMKPKSLIKYNTYLKKPVNRRRERKKNQAAGAKGSIPFPRSGSDILRTRTVGPSETFVIS